MSNFLFLFFLLVGFVRSRNHESLKLVPQRGRRVQDTIHHGEHGLIVLLYQPVLDLIEARQLDLQRINIIDRGLVVGSGVGWNYHYILSFGSAVILEVVRRRDRRHYPSIQVLDIGAAPPQTLGTRPINEASRDAALQKEEKNCAELLPKRPPLLRLAVAHLGKPRLVLYQRGFLGQSLRT